MLSAASYVGLALSLLFLHSSRLMLELAGAADDKELLFREMAHRTKNDLALVDSFIALEQGLSDSEAEAARFDALRERIRCLAEAHSLLSKSDVSGRVGIDLYLDAIAKDLARRDGIRLELDFDKFETDFPLAVNLGLIMNELATNSLKHAFPDGRPGTLRLGLAHKGQRATLAVSDDGIGTSWPPAKEGLGVAIVKALVAKIEGSLEFADEGGSAWRIDFPLPVPIASTPPRVSPL